MSQSKSWTFTIFDYDAKSVEEFKTVDADLVCFQEEKSPTTGKLHIQGYVRFKTNYRLNKVKSTFGRTTHCEPAKGSSAQNLAYCTKEETATGVYRYQRGDFAKIDGKQGRRTDLEQAVELIRQGKSLEEINETVPVAIVKYHKGLIFSRNITINATAAKAFNRVCIVCYGRAGSGKSQWARQYALHRNLRVFSKFLSKSSDVQWFDGYDGEELLLLDDFTDAAVSYREILVWLDVYKHTVQTKGGVTNAAWRHVIITSNSDPCTWYASTHPGTERDALTRRLDYQLKAPGNPQYWFSDLFKVEDEYKARQPHPDLVVTRNFGSVSDGLSDGESLGRSDERKGEEERIRFSPSIPRIEDNSSIEGLSDLEISELSSIYTDD